MGGCIVLCSNALPETHGEAPLRVSFWFWHGAALLAYTTHNFYRQQ